MTSQGFDRSTFYERTAASFDPRAAFIFAGVGAKERIGDFGRIGGGRPAGRSIAPTRRWGHRRMRWSLPPPGTSAPRIIG
jgi:hypothetical protein